jgi:hypothetical protein
MRGLLKSGRIPVTNCTALGGSAPTINFSSQLSSEKGGLRIFATKYPTVFGVRCMAIRPPLRRASCLRGLTGILGSLEGLSVHDRTAFSELRRPVLTPSPEPSCVSGDGPELWCLRGRRNCHGSFANENNAIAVLEGDAGSRLPVVDDRILLPRDPSEASFDRHGDFAIA